MLCDSVWTGEEIVGKGSQHEVRRSRRSDGKGRSHQWPAIEDAIGQAVEGPCACRVH